MIIIDLACLAGLLLLHGFFVYADSVLNALRAGSIETESGESSATGWIQLIRRKHNVYHSAAIVGMSISTLSLGWYSYPFARDAAAALLDSLQAGATDSALMPLVMLLLFVLLAGLHAALATLIPAKLPGGSRQTSLRLVLIPLYPLFPFAWLLNTISGVVLNMFGLSGLSTIDDPEADDLRLLLERGQEAGTIQQEEQRLIKNVFDYSSRIAKQIMISRTQIVALELSSSPQKILQTMTEEGYSRMPVYKGDIDNVVGFIYAKDILTMMTHSDLIVLQDILRPAYFVPENKKINILLREFQQQRIHLAIVVDEFGGTAGLVSMEDIIEELVGEIQDEHDTEEPMVRVISQDEFAVNAATAISDVNEFLPEALPEGEEYDTVGGLLNVIFERIPDVNDTIDFGPYAFTIQSKSRRSVETVLLKRIPPHSPEHASAQ